MIPWDLIGRVVAVLFIFIKGFFDQYTKHTKKKSKTREEEKKESNSSGSNFNSPSENNERTNGNEGKESKPSVSDDNIPRFRKQSSRNEEQPQYLYINNSWSNKVLDVELSDKREGTHLIIYQKKDILSDNQLWYFDKDGFIVSKLNKFYIDTTEGRCARLKPRQEGKGKTHQNWTYDKTTQTIERADDPDIVLDIRWALWFNCSKVIEYPYHGRPNQVFELVPVPANLVPGEVDIPDPK